MPTRSTSSTRISGITGEAQPVDAQGRFVASTGWKPTTVNLAPAERDAVEAAAAAAGMSRSGWLRLVVQQALAAQAQPQ